MPTLVTNNQHNVSFAPGYDIGVRYVIEELPVLMHKLEYMVRHFDLWSLEYIYIYICFWKKEIQLVKSLNKIKG